jgi:hypothetical protein
MSSHGDLPPDTFRKLQEKSGSNMLPHEVCRSVDPWLNIAVKKVATSGR